MSAERTDQRATDLLPEEAVAGSDDQQAQAAAILADSDDREDHPAPLEERTSAESADTTR